MYPLSQEFRTIQIILGNCNPFVKQTVGNHMQRIFVLLAIVGIAGLEALAQSKEHFTVEDKDSVDKIYFYLKAASGTHEIRTRKGENPINIMGHHNEGLTTCDFGTKKEGNVNKAWFTLKDDGKEDFGTKLSKIFGKKKTDEDNYWNIYLTDAKPYKLDLNYGVGKAYVDLSDIAVESCRIYSGNAHVKVGYLSMVENLTNMDTLVVSVELGDIEIEKLNLARAKNILAEVGIGTLVMDFNESPEIGSDIWARVGAGTLYIKLPEEEMPMIIRMKGTSYNKFKLPKGFEQLSENVFVNSSYDEAAENLVTFNIDLSMGSVIFKAD